MSEPKPLSEGFKAAVLAWLQANPGSRRTRAVEVTSVVAYGTDWAGDTAGGFHSEADVTITYRDTEGAEHHREISGEEMGDLWDHVMGAWPT